MRKLHRAGFARVLRVAGVKLAAYPFQKYGTLEGVVKTVSADSSAPTGCIASMVLEYLLSPVQRVGSEAARER